MKMMYKILLSLLVTASVASAQSDYEMNQLLKAKQDSLEAKRGLEIGGSVKGLLVNSYMSSDQEKAEKLIRQRAELQQKIQAERKRLLEEDSGAKKLREEILLLNRKLASLLETKKSMIELNSQLRDLDIAISRLKPAPEPEKETEPAAKAEAKTETKADAKADAKTEAKPAVKTDSNAKK